MSTHCGIAIKTEKGYCGIYCHFEGYYDYMYPMLTQNYNSAELAANLISKGNASYIDKLLNPTSDYHKFVTPEPGVSMFYYRDRGEDWSDVAPKLYTKEEFLSTFYHAYIFEDGMWNAYLGSEKI